MTGMPAATSSSAWGRTRRPPSSLTACAPASLRNLIPAASAAAGDAW